MFGTQPSCPRPCSTSHPPASDAGVFLEKELRDLLPCQVTLAPRCAQALHVYTQNKGLDPAQDAEVVVRLNLLCIAGRGSGWPRSPSPSLLSWRGQVLVIYDWALDIISVHIYICIFLEM